MAAREAPELSSRATFVHAHRMSAATEREVTSETKPVVLIVDDDEDIRESVASILRVEGYDVDVACHGKEALDRLVTAAPPSLILLDLMMPVMDGRTFLQELD